MYITHVCKSLVHNFERSIDRCINIQCVCKLPQLYLFHFKNTVNVRNLEMLEMFI
jgi:hypothetical protein